MTYCVAALASSGIVFASDSRTNAGTEDVASYSKMTVFETPGERVVEGDAYLQQLSRLWTRGMAELCASAPAVSWH